MMKMFCRIPVLLLVFLFLMSPAVFGQEGPAGGQMLRNGGFEAQPFQRENLWDGVNSEGFLAGETGGRHGRIGPPVLGAGGGVYDQSLPVSVSVADLNGDGLQDIAAMDYPGQLRVYFNSGTPTEPKFSVGELAPLFLSRILNTDPTLQWIPNPSRNQDYGFIRHGQRIHLADLLKTGKKDLVAGNYLGEILVVPNTGSAQRPEFRTPANLQQARLHPTGPGAPALGNLLSPFVFDWNRDGKDDLIIGEGSYSANTIRLLPNEGASNSPRFDPAKAQILAYGMGLEQLAPVVEDFNGDGKPDLLVAESGGKVAVYLHPAEPWKPGSQLAFSGFVKQGGGLLEAADRNPLDLRNESGLLSLDGIFSMAAGDLNGDGLFDLVFGKKNGRIAAALNKGSKTEPKFEAPVELQGTRGTPKLNIPPDWDFELGREKGNFLALIGTADSANDPGAAPAEGGACLRIGYSPSPNTILPAPDEKAMPPGEKAFKPSEIDIFWQDAMQNFKLHGVDGIVSTAPANFFAVRQWGDSGKSPLVPGKTYTFSLKAKGSDVGFASAYIGAVARIEGEDLSQQAGARGGVQRRRGTTGRDRTVFKEIKFSPGQNWTGVSADLPVRFGDKRIMDAKDNPALKIDWAVYIVAELKPGVGVLYIDDIKVAEKK